MQAALHGAVDLIEGDRDSGQEHPEVMASQDDVSNAAAIEECLKLQSECEASREKYTRMVEHMDCSLKRIKNLLVIFKWAHECEQLEESQKQEVGEGKGDDASSSNGTEHDSMSSNGKGDDPTSSNGKEDDSISSNGKGDHSISSDGKENDSVSSTGKEDDSVSPIGKEDDPISSNGKDNDSVSSGIQSPASFEAHEEEDQHHDLDTAQTTPAASEASFEANTQCNEEKDQKKPLHWQPAPSVKVRIARPNDPFKGFAFPELDDIVSLVGAYSGKADELETWSSKVDKLWEEHDFYEYDPEDAAYKLMLLKALPDTFRGDALGWYVSGGKDLLQASHWQDWKIALKARFGGTFVDIWIRHK